jgi:hypothetical protein
VTRAAFPYIRPQADVVRADVWMLKTGDLLREAPAYLDGWDYYTELSLARELRADVNAMRRQANLSAEAPLSLSVSAFSTASWVRKRVFHQALTSEAEDVTIEVALPGDDLGGNVRLITSVVLNASRESDQPFVAHLSGSVLWSDHYEIRLQGDAPLFPISVIDFERAGFPAGAGWHLDIGADLSAPLHASIRLYLNSSHSAVVAAFANAGTPRPEDKAITRAVFADVARLMVEHALNQEDLGGANDWDESSIGFALQNLLHRFFPHGEDISAVRSHRIDHPSDFSTELFAKLRIFDD